MKLEELLAANYPEWLDDDQARSLFSPFSQPRAFNPEAYETRLNFWRSVLLDAARQRLVGSSVFVLPSPSVVSGIFVRKGSRPLGIAHVMVAGNVFRIILSGADG